jgi:hypothetical protein
MSNFNVSDIKPEITLKRDEVVSLLLSSIALEEISLSNIINAEAEKVQHVLKKEYVSFDQLLKLNNSVERTLRSVLSNQLLLQLKLSDVLKIELDNKEESYECEEE